ncbi:hypothetical protein NY406_10230 [Chlorobaculum sp. MV4-Y]|jgi:hypothetical protein|uniref:hypothetical protein n=1 Tax=Chlorobaculum sp. MV4-Y TaxID=2976335 RepID=UPI0021AFBF9D|nr:hypothetical protein [Chlorobaculum sp. MV4-Y]UWX57558.1 hypothetical protein NY406_10230 [Chlorobaculum sp. MV4-Y]
MQTRTLVDFFGNMNRDASPFDTLQKKRVFEELRKNLPTQEHALNWKPVWNSVVDHVGKLLDIDLAEIMLRAWKNYFDLSKYADTETYPPDRSYLEPLIEHTISSRHKPEIEIKIDQIISKTIAFDISIQLNLKGFTLEITGGKIMKIHTGECSGKGSVKCLDVTLLEKALGTITLPGIIDLGEGIPVRQT